MQILVVNAGSSSLKLRIVDDADQLVASDDLPAPEPDSLRRALSSFLTKHPGIDVAAHRVVHGGSTFRQAHLLDDHADASLQALADLAPLHNPRCLAAIHALRALRPALRQVACFDTTFHADMPAKASVYAVPRAWRERWSIRRYGFHGASHSWASRRAAELLGLPREQLRLVTAHLGSGASLAAVAFGRSVDTTMGFTPMEGLVMATRSGSVDPGAVLWVQRHGGQSAAEVERSLDRDSGLRGLWGGSGDLRQVLAAVDGRDPQARLAYEVYVYRIQTNTGAMVAAMGGLDGLVFTGGAGEASARLRADVCDGLGYLGLTLDTAANSEPGGDRLVSPPGGPAAVLVVQAREDLDIARQVRELLG